MLITPGAPLVWPFFKRPVRQLIALGLQRCRRHRCSGRLRGLVLDDLVFGYANTTERCANCPAKIEVSFQPAFEASIGLADGEILAGELPRKQLRLVQAWIELHRDELVADWELAVSGENPYKVEPL